MAKSVFLLLLFTIVGGGALWAWQGDKTVVLRDGRQLLINGDYEVSSKGVTFTEVTGRTRTLPHDQVDLTATERANNPAKKTRSATGAGSINDEIAAHRNKGDLQESLAEINQKLARTPGRHQAVRPQLGDPNTAHIGPAVPALDSFKPHASWYPRLDPDLEYRVRRAQRYTPWLTAFLTYGALVLAGILILRNLFMLALAYRMLNETSFLLGVILGLAILSVVVSFRLSLMIGLLHTIAVDLIFCVSLMVIYFDRKGWILAAVSSPYVLGLSWLSVVLYCAFG